MKKTMLTFCFIICFICAFNKNSYAEETTTYFASDDWALSEYIKAHNSISVYERMTELGWNTSTGTVIIYIDGVPYACTISKAHAASDGATTYMYCCGYEITLMNKRTGDTGLSIGVKQKNTDSTEGTLENYDMKRYEGSERWNYSLKMYNFNEIIGKFMNKYYGTSYYRTQWLYDVLTNRNSSYYLVMDSFLSAYINGERQGQMFESGDNGAYSLVGKVCHSQEDFESTFPQFSKDLSANYFNKQLKPATNDPIVLAQAEEVIESDAHGKMYYNSTDGLTYIRKGSILRTNVFAYSTLPQTKKYIYPCELGYSWTGFGSSAGTNCSGSWTFVRNTNNNSDASGDTSWNGGLFTSMPIWSRRRAYYQTTANGSNAVLDASGNALSQVLYLNVNIPHGSKGYFSYIANINWKNQASNNLCSTGWKASNARYYVDGKAPIISMSTAGSNGIPDEGLTNNMSILINNTPKLYFSIKEESDEEAGVDTANSRITIYNNTTSKTVYDSANVFNNISIVSNKKIQVARTLDVSDSKYYGNLTITVTATDQVGNTRTEKININVNKDDAYTSSLTGRIRFSTTNGTWYEPKDINNQFIASFTKNGNSFYFNTYDQINSDSTTLFVNGLLSMLYLADYKPQRQYLNLNYNNVQATNNIQNNTVWLDNQTMNGTNYISDNNWILTMNFINIEENSNGHSYYFQATERGLTGSNEIKIFFFDSNNNKVYEKSGTLDSIGRVLISGPAIYTSTATKIKIAIKKNTDYINNAAGMLKILNNNYWLYDYYGATNPNNSSSYVKVSANLASKTSLNLLYCGIPNTTSGTLHSNFLNTNNWLGNFYYSAGGQHYYASTDLENAFSFDFCNSVTDNTVNSNGKCTHARVGNFKLNLGDKVAFMVSHSGSVYDNGTHVKSVNPKTGTMVLDGNSPLISVYAKQNSHSYFSEIANVGNSNVSSDVNTGTYATNVEYPTAITVAESNIEIRSYDYTSGIKSISVTAHDMIKDEDLTVIKTEEIATQEILGINNNINYKFQLAEADDRDTKIKYTIEATDNVGWKTRTVVILNKYSTEVNSTIDITGDNVYKANEELYYIKKATDFTITSIGTTPNWDSAAIRILRNNIGTKTTGSLLPLWTYSFTDNNTTPTQISRESSYDAIFPVKNYSAVYADIDGNEVTSGYGNKVTTNLTSTFNLENGDYRYFTSNFELYNGSVKVNTSANATSAKVVSDGISPNVELYVYSSSLLTGDPSSDYLKNSYTATGMSNIYNGGEINANKGEKYAVLRFSDNLSGVAPIVSVTVKEYNTGTTRTASYKIRENGCINIFMPYDVNIVTIKVKDNVNCVTTYSFTYFRPNLTVSNTMGISLAKYTDTENNNYVAKGRPITIQSTGTSYSDILSYYRLRDCYLGWNQTDISKCFRFYANTNSNNSFHTKTDFNDYITRESSSISFVGASSTSYSNTLRTTLNGKFMVPDGEAGKIYSCFTLYSWHTGEILKTTDWIQSPTYTSDGKDPTIKIIYKNQDGDNVIKGTYGGRDRTYGTSVSNISISSPIMTTQNYIKLQCNDATSGISSITINAYDMVNGTTLSTETIQETETKDTGEKLKEKITEIKLMDDNLNTRVKYTVTVTDNVGFSTKVIFYLVKYTTNINNTIVFDGDNVYKPSETQYYIRKDSNFTLTSVGESSNYDVSTVNLNRNVLYTGETGDINYLTHYVINDPTQPILGSYNTTWRNIFPVNNYTMTYANTLNSTSTSVFGNKLTSVLTSTFGLAHNSSVKFGSTFELQGNRNTLKTSDVVKTPTITSDGKSPNISLYVSDTNTTSTNESNLKATYTGTTINDAYNAGNIFGNNNQQYIIIKAADSVSGIKSQNTTITAPNSTVTNSSDTNTIRQTEDSYVIQMPNEKNTVHSVITDNVNCTSTIDFVYYRINKTTTNTISVTGTSPYTDTAGNKYVKKNSDITITSVGTNSSALTDICRLKDCYLGWNQTDTSKCNKFYTKSNTDKSFTPNTTFTSIIPQTAADSSFNAANNTLTTTYTGKFNLTDNTSGKFNSNFTLYLYDTSEILKTTDWAYSDTYYSDGKDPKVEISYKNESNTVTLNETFGNRDRTYGDTVSKLTSSKTIVTPNNYLKLKLSDTSSGIKTYTLTAYDTVNNKALTVEKTNEANTTSSTTGINSIKELEFKIKDAESVNTKIKYTLSITDNVGWTTEVEFYSIKYATSITNTLTFDGDNVYKQSLTQYYIKKGSNFTLTSVGYTSNYDSEFIRIMKNNLGVQPSTAVIPYVSYTFKNNTTLPTQTFVDTLYKTIFPISSYTSSYSNTFGVNPVNYGNRVTTVLSGKFDLTSGSTQKFASNFEIYKNESTLLNTSSNAITPNITSDGDSPTVELYANTTNTTNPDLSTLIGTYDNTGLTNNYNIGNIMKANNTNYIILKITDNISGIASCTTEITPHGGTKATSTQTVSGNNSTVIIQMPGEKNTVKTTIKDNVGCTTTLDYTYYRLNKGTTNTISITAPNSYINASGVRYIKKGSNITVTSVGISDSTIPDVCRLRDCYLGWNQTDKTKCNKFYTKSNTDKSFIESTVFTSLIPKISTDSTFGVTLKTLTTTYTGRFNLDDGVSGKFNSDFTLYSYDTNEILKTTDWAYTETCISDGTAPSIELWDDKKLTGDFLKTTGGKIYDEYVSPTIKLADSGSGIKTVTYAITNLTTASTTGGDSITYTDGPKTKNYVIPDIDLTSVVNTGILRITIAVTDQVGNSNSISYYIDNTPIISINANIVKSATNERNNFTIPFENKDNGYLEIMVNGYCDRVVVSFPTELAVDVTKNNAYGFTVTGNSVEYVFTDISMFNPTITPVFTSKYEGMTEISRNITITAYKGTYSQTTTLTIPLGNKTSRTDFKTRIDSNFYK